MKRVNYFSLFLLGMMSFLNSSLYAQQDDFQMYYQARKFLQQREYDKAKEFFESLQKQYPSSRYTDDAEFWSAYILEKQGKEADAFAAYDNLIARRPNSPWVDDAEANQIGIAERFVKNGDHAKMDFIVRKLDSPDKKIKYQAAVSLGKLRDQRALPVLKQMENNGDKDMSTVAKSLISDFNEARPIKSNPRQRIEVEPKKQFNEIRPGQKMFRSPQRYNTSSQPNNQKQVTLKNNSSPTFGQPSRQSPSPGRRPAGNNKPAAPPSNTKKPLPAKKK